MIPELNMYYEYEETIETDTTGEFIVLTENKDIKVPKGSQLEKWLKKHQNEVIYADVSDSYVKEDNYYTEVQDYDIDEFDLDSCPYTLDESGEYFAPTLVTGDEYVKIVYEYQSSPEYYISDGFSDCNTEIKALYFTLDGKRIKADYAGNDVEEGMDYGGPWW